MAYAKAWKVAVTQLEALIEAADSQGNCFIEIYSDSSSTIVDGELWLKLSDGWADNLPVVPPVIPLPE